MARIKDYRKLSVLKQEVYDLWCHLHILNDALCIQSSPTEDRGFKREVKNYGDLRCKSTWERAFAIFESKTLWYSNDDNQFLIEFYLIQAPRKEGYSHLLPQVIEGFIAIPTGLEMLLDGFRQIDNYGCGYGSSIEEVKETLNYVQQATGRLRATESESRSLPAAV